MSRTLPGLQNPEAIEALDKVGDDGRNIDKGMGTLSGEAARQATLETKYDTALHSQAYPYVPTHQPSANPTYYEIPMLKQPVWKWDIAAYFYIGGAAGASAALGAAAQLCAPRSMRSLITRANWIGTVGGAISAFFLIYDLGRPSRFLNMLRVFRVTSPMSMGSWILSVFSTCAGGAAVLPLGPALFRRLASPLGLIAGLFGLGLSSYTGVLLAQTPGPVWQQSYRTLPILFVASGTAASAAIFEFFSWNDQELRAIERFGLVGKVGELLAAMALEREASRVERVGRPLKRGFSGFLWQSAKILTAAGIVLALLPGKGRGKRIASGVLGTAGTLGTRFGIFYAGKASSRDPRATFDQQRHIPPPSVPAGIAN
jgi:hypothetical protein